MSRVYVVVVRTESCEQYVYVFDYVPEVKDIYYRVWVEEGSADNEDINLQWYGETCRIYGYWCNVESEGCLTFGGTGVSFINDER